MAEKSEAALASDDLEDILYLVEGGFLDNDDDFIKEIEEIAAEVPGDEKIALGTEGNMPSSLPLSLSSSTDEISRRKLHPLQLKAIVLRCAEKDVREKHKVAKRQSKKRSLRAEKHRSASEIILVNDPCDLEMSIKDSEHDRQAEASSYIEGTRNVFIREEDKLPPPIEFVNFFKNPGNKIRLQHFLRIQFSSISSIII
eukprot:gene10148-18813_t